MTTDQPAPHLTPDLEHDTALLREAAEIGVDILRTLHRQITAEAAAATPPAPEHREPTAAAVERLLRGIRRTLHLRQHLRQNALTTSATRAVARAQIIRRVQDTIHRETRAKPGRHDPDHLAVELRDRLETLEFEQELQSRPIDDIIVDIVHDLGLGAVPGVPPRPRRTPTDLLTLHRQAAAPPNPAHEPSPTPPSKSNPPSSDPPPSEPPAPPPRNPNAGMSLLEYTLRKR